MRGGFSMCFSFVSEGFADVFSAVGMEDVGGMISRYVDLPPSCSLSYPFFACGLLGRVQFPLRARTDHRRHPRSQKARILAASSWIIASTATRGIKSRRLSPSKGIMWFLRRIKDAVGIWGGGDGVWGAEVGAVSRGQRWRYWIERRVTVVV